MATSSGGPEAAAFAHFANRDFDRAVEALQKIPQRLRGEARVQHNMAVAAFYRGGCVEIKRLVDALGALATAANAAAEQAPGGPAGAEDVTGGLGLATLSYNQAVLFYHLRRYSASLEILEGGLYRNIEALDEDLALRVCLLLVEVHLVLGQGAKAAAVLLFVEKTFCAAAAATRSGASTGDDSASNGSASSSTTPQQRASASSSSSNSSSGGNRPQLSLGPEQLQFVVHLYRARVQLLAKSANATKKELKQAGEALLLMQQQQPQQNANTGTGGPAGQLAFLKAHLEYTRRNYRKSLKLLNASQKRFAATNGDGATPSPSSASPPPSPSDGLSAPYFNNMGCIHYQLAKYGAAAFYLTKAVRDDWASTAEASTAARTSRRCEMYYNQGIQLLVTGKPGVAFRCLLRAADTHHHQPRLWLRLAQCTIATHLANERDAALRHQKSDAIARVTSHGSGSKQRQVVLPVHPPPSSSFALAQTAAAATPSPLPAIPLPTTLSSTADASSAAAADNAGGEQQDSSASGVQPALTLRYGLECLRNALKLLEHSPETTTTPPTAASAAPATVGGGAKPAPGTDAAASAASAAPSTPGAGDSAASGLPVPAPTTSLECVCLLSMAYIALALEDPVVALAAAGAALNGGSRSAAHAPNGVGGTPPVIDDEHRLVAHLYAAEALCMLNRPAEAMQHLSPSLVKDIPASLPSSSSSSSSSGGASSSSSSAAASAPGAFGPAPPTQFGLAPALASSARYVLYVNLAAAHILQDKLPQAQKCLLHATAVHPASPHALLLQTYIELARGNTAAALDLLQRGKIVPPSATPGSTSGAAAAAGQQPQDGRSGPSFSAQPNSK